MFADASRTLQGAFKQTLVAVVLTPHTSLDYPSCPECTTQRVGKFRELSHTALFETSTVNCEYDMSGDGRLHTGTTPQIPNEAIFTAHVETSDAKGRHNTGVTSPASALSALDACLKSRDTTRWHRIGENSRADGLIVDVAFGAAFFLGGHQNAELKNLIKILQGDSIEGLRGTLRRSTLEEPTSMTKCLAHPIIVRAIIDPKSASDFRHVDELRLDPSREITIEPLALSLHNIIAVRLYGLQDNLWKFRLEQLTKLNQGVKTTLAC